MDKYDVIVIWNPPDNLPNISTMLRDELLCVA
jgi:hypothetical protein